MGVNLKDKIMSLGMQENLKTFKHRQLNTDTYHPDEGSESSCKEEAEENGGFEAIESSEEEPVEKKKVDTKLEGMLKVGSKVVRKVSVERKNKEKQIVAHRMEIGDFGFEYHDG